MSSDPVKWIPQSQDLLSRNTDELWDASPVTDILGPGHWRGVLTGRNRLVVWGEMPLSPWELSTAGPFCKAWSPPSHAARGSIPVETKRGHA